MGLNVLLVFVPIALALDRFDASPSLVFLTSALGIVPLAGLMGRATENLAAHVGEALGGLMNASLGNAPELIIAIFALREGLHDVVKASITGSILGNSLLTLGLAMLAGGWRHQRQQFNRTAASMSAGLLLLAAIGLTIPAIFHMTTVRQERELSLEIASVLFIIYLLSLVFTLKTHRTMFEGEAVVADREPDEAGAWSKQTAVMVLITATLALAVMSETLVGAIAPSAASLGLTPVFAGVILLSMVGNAAEMANAVRFALKNKMDLTFGLSIGSSIQVALFVAPMLVFSSYLMGKPLDLLFTPFEIAAVTIAVLIVGNVTKDGVSHWMEGAMLVGVYVMLAYAFYFLPA